LPKNLFAEFLFAEKYCFNFAENFICGIADLRNCRFAKFLASKQQFFSGKQNFKSCKIHKNGIATKFQILLKAGNDLHIFVAMPFLCILHGMPLSDILS
jgi:hypothetical protein